MASTTDALTSVPLVINDVWNSISLEGVIDANFTISVSAHVKTVIGDHGIDQLGCRLR